MAANPEDFNFFLSGGGGNSDPLLSFGGAKSATKIEELQSTLTAIQGGDQRIFFDSARIGDGDDTHVDKWILTMNDDLDAARVIAFRSSDGRFTLENRLSTQGQIGDIYRLFDLDSLLHEVTALECAQGHTDYRLLYFDNQSGETVNNWGGYHEMKTIGVQAAGVGVELWSDDDTNPVEGTPADHLTKPAGTSANSDFTEALDFLGILRQPQQGATGNSMTDGSWRNLYVRRIVPSNARRQPYAAVLIVIEVTDQSPGQVRSGVLLPFGLLGFTPEVTISRDRGPILTQQQLDDGYGSSVRVGHGARYSALVKAQETGLPVPSLEVGWALDGPGQLYTDEAPVTDGDGISTITYSAPSETTKTRQTIALDSETAHPIDASQNFAQSGSFSHTVPAGTERILIVRTIAAAIADPPADMAPYSGTVSCTFGGVAMKSISRAFSTSGGVCDVWLLIDPPVGAGTVAFVFPGVVDGFAAIASSFSGVDQAQALDVVVPAPTVSQNDTSGALSLDITTATAGALLFEFLMTSHPIDVAVNPDSEQVAVLSSLAGIAPPVATTFGDTKPAASSGAQSVGWSSVNSGSDLIGQVLALRPALATSILTAKV